MFKDILNFNDFKLRTDKSINYPNVKPDLYNRLVAHTTNFFAIAGLGAFTENYLLILPKELISSYAHLEENKIEEFNWFLNLITNSINETKRKYILFEHGMCACSGGLDRAHLHLMSVKKDINNNEIVLSINNALKRRLIGVKNLKYNGHIFHHRHDICQILSEEDKKNYKINGLLQNLKNLKNKKNFYKWPKIVTKTVKKGGQYIYFNSGSKESSFLTTQKIDTQLGREIVYYIDNKKIINNKNLDSFIKDWRWQDNYCNEAITKTLIFFNKKFKYLKKKNFSFKYQFEFPN